VITGLKVKYAPSSAFYDQLCRRVEAYFETSGLSPRDQPRIYLKTAILLAWLATAYGLLVFAVHSAWLAAPLAMLVGLAGAGIGFNVQHDGGHNAYSEHKWINRVMAMTIDLLGGSSYVWNWKHNIIHHSYPNIAGADDDIEIQPLGRMSPHQKRHPAHRLQFLYMWLLYGLLAVKWHLFDDYRQVLTGRITGHRFPRPRGWDLVVFVAGKVFFYAWVFVIPTLYHPFKLVMLFYAIGVFTLGIVLATVFQLAHVVEEADFPLQDEAKRISHEWAEHQIRTSVDFGRERFWPTWYTGGLNFQIEHHLFPRISHAHYPAISRIVESTCREFGVPYYAHETTFRAIRSHLRWLYQMGLPAAPANQARERDHQDRGRLSA
jgi:linoleoyl-CoA desaturase